MATVGDFWSTDFWASDFWADGFWAGTAVVPVVPTPTTLSGGGKRIKWSDIYPEGKKEPVVTVEMTTDEALGLLGRTEMLPTREDAILLALLLHTLDED